VAILVFFRFLLKIENGASEEITKADSISLKRANRIERAGRKAIGLKLSS